MVFERGAVGALVVVTRMRWEVSRHLGKRTVEMVGRLLEEVGGRSCCSYGVESRVRIEMVVGRRESFGRVVEGSWGSQVEAEMLQVISWRCSKGECLLPFCAPPDGGAIVGQFCGAGMVKVAYGENTEQTCRKLCRPSASVTFHISPVYVLDRETPKTANECPVAARRRSQVISRPTPRRSSRCSIRLVHKVTISSVWGMHGDRKPYNYIYKRHGSVAQAPHAAWRFSTCSLEEMKR